MPALPNPSLNAGSQSSSLVLALSVALLGAAAYAGIRVLLRASQRRKRRKAIQALIRDCKGDQELAERLMWQELEREPELSYTQAASQARARLLRDQR